MSGVDSMVKHRRGRDSFNWLRLFLTILLVACIFTIAWTVKQIFTNHISRSAAIILILTAVGVLIWNILLLHRYKVTGGIVFALFIVIAVISSTTFAFAGVEPFASLKQKLVTSATSSSIQAGPQLPSTINLPQGTYSATIFGFVETVTFSGNTLTMYNEMDGKRIFECSFPAGIESGKIQVRNVVTNEVGITDFKYDRQYNCVTIGKITYYK